MSSDNATMQFALRSDRALIRAGARSVRFMEVAVTAPCASPRAGRIPVNIALIIDRSSARRGDGSFALAREAAGHVVRLLRAEDRLAVIAFDSNATVLVPATPATRETKRLALAKLRDLSLEGGSDLQAGWMAGASELAGVLTGQSVNRALLITNGLGAHGAAAGWEFGARSAELRRSGIVTSTFAVGDDFDEHLLRDIAHEGGGNFHVVRDTAQIAELFASELGETLEIVSRNAVLHLALPPGAEASLLAVHPRESSPEREILDIPLGDLHCDQDLSRVVRIRFGSGNTNQIAPVRAWLTDDDSVSALATTALEWRYATHVANDAQLRDAAVDRVVAAVYASRARLEARDAVLAGDVEGGRRALERTAVCIRGYANGDETLVSLWHALRDESEQLAGHALLPRAGDVIAQARTSAEPQKRARHPQQGSPQPETS